MIHTEHLRWFDESYECRHNNKGDAVHAFFKDGCYIIFQSLHELVKYVYLGEGDTERFYVDEQDIDELYASEFYDYHNLQSVAKQIEVRRLYPILPFEWFAENTYQELSRYENGKFLHSVTCTPENYHNLFKSQTNPEGYGTTYRYKLWEGE